ncbi:MAG: hypothetical protein M3P49_16415, partial [Actinomycetota bacterium]|nr:hypothetical protein [Actinomycetota bacterium]
HKIRIIESSRERAVVEGIRRDDPGHAVRITFDEEDARLAGLAGKGGHKTYPAALKLARATSALCRAAFADSVAGISYVPEELGAEVDEEGEVLSVPARPEAARRAEEPLEEAEVVEGEPEFHPEHRRKLEQLDELRARIPQEHRPDRAATRTYAEAKYANACAAVQRLEGIIERLADEANGSEDEDDGGEDPGPPLEEENPPDFEDMRGAASRSPDDKAHKSQVDMLTSLVMDLAGEQGIKDLQKHTGKTIQDLTAQEADYYIERYSPRNS